MFLEIIDRTASRIELYGKKKGTFGIDSGSSSHLHFSGDLFGSGNGTFSPTSRYVKRGAPFRLTLKRQGSTLVCGIDDNEVNKLTLAEKELGQFAVVPFRGRIRLYQVVLTKQR